MVPGSTPAEHVNRIYAAVCGIAALPDSSSG